MMAKVQANMKKQHIVILLVILSFTALRIMNLNTLSILNTAKEVNIDLGYNSGEQYWIVTALINEKQAMKLVIHEDDFVEMTDNEMVVAQNTISFVLEPLLPFVEATTTPSGMDYIKNRYSLAEWKKLSEIAPVYNINDGTWLTTVPYNIAIFENDNLVKDMVVKMNYQQSGTFTIELTDGDIIVDNLGFLAQGVEQPSGDLVIMLDPDDEPHISSWADVRWSIDEWDWYATRKLPIATNWEWGDVYTYWDGNVFDQVYQNQWVSDRVNPDRNDIPDDVLMPYISEVVYGDNYESISLEYNDIVYSGLITIMIPDSMVDSIIVQLFAPHAVITEVKPAKLPPVKEGDTTDFEVTVRNDGTQGTVSISAFDDNYLFQAITPSSVLIAEGETHTFKIRALALGTDKNVDTITEIVVDGRGGSDTYSLEGEVVKVENYTPPDPEPPSKPVENGDDNDDDDDDDFYTKWLKNPFGTIQSSIFTIMTFVVIIGIILILSKTLSLAAVFKSATIKSTK